MPISSVSHRYSHLLKAAFIAFIFFISIAIFSTVKADDTVLFSLDDDGTSDIYWPFYVPDNDDLKEKHKLYWLSSDQAYDLYGKDNYVGSRHGEGLHQDSDYYAEDWNLYKNKKSAASADCNTSFYSPISGKALFVGNANNGYGEQIIIQSDVDDTYAFRISHLRDQDSEYTPPAIDSGDNIGTGEYIGQVETTGTSSGCHAHMVLYKNLNETDINRLEIGAQPTQGLDNAAQFSLTANKVNSCEDNQFLGSYYNGTDFLTEPVMTRCEYSIDHDWESYKPYPNVDKDNFSVIWEGDFALRGGDYSFETNSDDGVSLWIHGDNIIRDWEKQSLDDNHASKDLDDGIWEIYMEYFDDKGPATVNLEWTIESDPEDNTAPVVSDIPDQTIEAGQQFNSFDLDNYVTDPYPLEQFTWEITGNTQIQIAVNDDNVVTISYPEGFLGSEELTFTVKDELGATSSDTATFKVEEPTLACDIEVSTGNTGGLVHAIDTANSNPDQTVICLTPGLSYQFGTVHNVIYGNTGLGVISTPVVIQGNDSTIEHFDDWPTPAMRYFAVAPSGSLSLYDLTIKEGYDLGETLSAPTYGGGAIYVDQGTLNIDNVKFYDNTGQTKGGGAISITNATVNIANSEFLQNQAIKQGSGGAIVSRGLQSVISISDTTFDSNYGDNIGGALYNQGTMTLDNVTLYNNRSRHAGGAVFSYNGSILATNSIFDSNFVVETTILGQGGAIFNNDLSSLNIQMSQFLNNSTPNGGNGGAITSEAPVDVIQSCFVDNTDTAVFNLESPIALNFSNNWWGASDGPGGAGSGAGDSVSGDVDYSNYLTSAPSYCQ